MRSHVLPPSEVLYTPQPALELRKILASPVPTQTTSGFFGSMAMSPIEAVGISSKTGSKVVPSFTDFHTPPVAEPTHIVYCPPLGETASTSVHRPLILVGPMYCQFRSLYGDEAFRSAWALNIFTRSVPLSTGCFAWEKTLHGNNSRRKTNNASINLPGIFRVMIARLSYNTPISVLANVV